MYEEQINNENMFETNTTIIEEELKVEVILSIPQGSTKHGQASSYSKITDDIHCSNKDDDWVKQNINKENSITSNLLLWKLDFADIEMAQLMRKLLREQAAQRWILMYLMGTQLSTTTSLQYLKKW